MQSTNNLLDKTFVEVVEIRKSLKFTQNKLNEELKSVKKDITKIKSEIKELIGSLLVFEKLIELEDRSQRNNLPIEKITEQPNET